MPTCWCPTSRALTKQAAQRLDAIQQMEELGSGFYLAMHDLEIRGAGEVLGENQSGNMMEVGFQLYNDMLAEAVRSLKAGQRARPAGAAVGDHRDQPARAGAAARRLLRRRARAADRSTSGWRPPSKPEQIDALLEEIIDRFGKLPPQGADAVRRAPPARAGQALRRGQDRRRRRSVIEHHVQAEPAGRCDAHHRAGAEEPPHQAGRQRQAAHRARARRSRSDRAQMVRDVLRALGQPKVAEPA